MSSKIVLMNDYYHPGLGVTFNAGVYGTLKEISGISSITLKDRNGTTHTFQLPDELNFIKSSGASSNLDIYSKKVKIGSKKKVFVQNGDTHKVEEYLIDKSWDSYLQEVGSLSMVVCVKDDKVVLVPSSEVKIVDDSLSL